MKLLPWSATSSIGRVYAWHASGPEFDPYVQHILSWRLGHENISTAILPLSLIQEEQLSVTGERMCIKLLLPVLLCAVKTVEGDFRFCWTITPNVGQTHKENPNLVRILYMVCTLTDIYKQYNKLHEHWYTKISSLRCVADRNPPQNSSDWYTKYWSYAEHCRPCTRLSGVNWWKQKQITLIVPIGYSLFADHRSVPSSGPGFVCLTYFCPSRVCAH